RRAQLDMAREQGRVTGISAARLRLAQELSERECIAQAEVEALRADRMHGLRRIADQHATRRRGARGEHPRERIRLAPAGAREAPCAPAEALVHEREERVIVERRHLWGIGRGYAEHEARATFAERQQRDRTRIG